MNHPPLRPVSFNFALILILAIGGALSPAPNASASRPAPGSFPAKWIDGRDAGEPQVQVHAYNQNTYIFRQSLKTNFEAPFLYLFLGEDRALLEDTGAGNCNITEPVYKIVEEWKSKHHKKSYPLIAAHSHGHGDHTAGDADFAKLTETTVVGKKAPEVQKFFNITNWPADAASFDLGGRVLHILPIPGHQKASIAIYDEQTSLLLMGDSLYPGRLYVEDFETYKTSIARVVEFTEKHPVSWILGTHIEMTTTPKKDFPLSARERADERVLQLEKKHLLLLNEELKKMEGKAKRVALDDFIIYPIER